MKINMIINQIRQAKIIDMLENGLNYQQIGDRVGLTRERVRQLLSLSGLKNPKVIATKFTCQICKLKFSKQFKTRYKIAGDVCGNCQRKKWSPKFNLDACSDCGQSNVPHLCYGRCQRCGNNYMYKTDPVYKDTRLLNTLKSYKKHYAKRTKHMREYGNAYFKDQYNGNPVYRTKVLQYQKDHPHKHKH